jgi:hypothetical protein
MLKVYPEFRCCGKAARQSQRRIRHHAVPLVGDLVDRRGDLVKVFNTSQLRNFSPSTKLFFKVMGTDSPELNVTDIV